METSEFGFSIDDLRSTSDKVCDVIRRAIISKTLPAGERLVEAKMAKDLKVSITPVRQTFAQLANQGLLTVYPFKGTYVTEITRKYVDDVLFVRKYLETAAVELCFNQLTAQDANTLQSYCEMSDNYFEEGNLYAAIDYDIMFHNYFFERCGNELLIEMWNSIKSRIQYIQSYTKPKTLPSHYMDMRHGCIIDALYKGNKQAFIERLNHHIETANTYAGFKSND
ncbi:MAG: GntR family transcriptional regulator [Clostridia bacterium]